MSDLKAISQNLMHKSLKTTDEIYSRLGDDDIASHIANLGRRSTFNEKLMREFAEFLFQRKIEGTQDKDT
jgi:hypothetical protein